MIWLFIGAVIVLAACGPMKLEATMESQDEQERLDMQCQNACPGAASAFQNPTGYCQCTCASNPSDILWFPITDLIGGAATWASWKAKGC